MSVLLIVVGFVGLIVGAEMLVRGASRLASVVGVPPLIIGLTIVAYGTSAPEFAVSLKASLAGSPDIALGNVVGSNIFNILFILGASALITPLSVSRQLIRLDVPLMIFVSVLTWLLSVNGAIGRFEGFFLFAGVLTYTVFLIVKGRRETRGNSVPEQGQAGKPAESEKRVILKALAWVCLGLFAVVVGSRWLVSGAVDLARTLGVSELVIALTIVATGTSLPEVATSIVASLRGQRDIAVGNVVGSNVFNLLGVLGASALVSGGVPISEQALKGDIPVMVAATVACFPIFFTSVEISRWEGGIFLFYYLVYLVYLVLHATGHGLLTGFLAGVWWFALPLTAGAIIVSFVHSLRSRPPHA